MVLRAKSQIGCVVTVVLIVCGVLFGCGPRDSLSRDSLTGKVTYKGQPLDHGMVGLLPMEGTKGPQGSGSIASDGTYEIITANKPGAVVGTHKVVIQCREKISAKEAQQMKVGQLLTPRRYATYDSTPLKVKVPSEGTVFDIELVD